MVRSARFLRPRSMAGRSCGVGLCGTFVVVFCLFRFFWWNPPSIPFILLAKFLLFRSLNHWIHRRIRIFKFSMHKYVFSRNSRNRITCFSQFSPFRGSPHEFDLDPRFGLETAFPKRGTHTIWKRWYLSDTYQIPLVSGILNPKFKKLQFSAESY